MCTATTTTFEVSNVMRATEPLPEVPYKEAVEATHDRDSFDRTPVHRKVEEPASVGSHSRSASITPGRSLHQIPREAAC